METKFLMKGIVLILILIFFGVTTWMIKKEEKEVIISSAEVESNDGWSIVVNPRRISAGRVFDADSFTYIDTVSGVLLNFVDGKVEIRVKK